MKRPPPGSRDPVGESRGNVRAVIVRQRVEMNEHNGTLAVPSIVAPQEGRLAHRDAVNEASLPQHRGATSRCGREGIVVGLPRPPCRHCRKKTAPRRHGGRRQLSPPGLAHQNIVRTDTAHTTTLSDVARPLIGCGVCSNEPVTTHQRRTVRENELAFFRATWRRVSPMMHIALRTTTASGAQALAVMCGARMCCCCRPC